MSKALTSSFVLAGLLATSITVMVHNSKRTNHNKPSSAKVIDAYMTGVSYKQFDVNGKIHSIMNTPKLLHFQANNSAYFIQPKMIIYTAKRIPWQVHARYGTSVDGTNIVHLHQHVMLHQPAMPQHPETTVTSSTLTVYPHKAEAKNNVVTHLERPGTRIEGKGVRADFHTGTVKLLSQSNGSYISLPK